MIFYRLFCGRNELSCRTGSPPNLEPATNRPNAEPSTRHCKTSPVLNGPTRQKRAGIIETQAHRHAHLTLLLRGSNSNTGQEPDENKRRSGRRIPALFTGRDKCNTSGAEHCGRSRPAKKGMLGDLTAGSGDSSLL